MDPEDFLAPEVAVTAVVTAAIFSPRARKLIRRGAVYGMAGLLIAGDAVASFARNVGQGVQQAAQSAADQTKAEVATAGATHKRATSKTTAEGTGG